MNYYKHITLEGVQYIQAVNPFPQYQSFSTFTGSSENKYVNPEWQAFDKANPPIIWYGPAFDGTISEEDIEITEEYRGRKPFESAVLRARPKEVEQPVICSVNCECKTGEDCHGEGALNLVALHDCERSFKEDYEHENGQYVNKCYSCQKFFMGHKRRITCKSCEVKEQPVQQEAPYIHTKGRIIGNGEEYHWAGNSLEEGKPMVQNVDFQLSDYDFGKFGVRLAAYPVQPSTPIVEEQKLSLLDCKNEVAKSYGYESYNHYINTPMDDLLPEHNDWDFHLSMVDEAAEIYASQKNKIESTQSGIATAYKFLLQHLKQTGCEFYYIAHASIINEIAQVMEAYKHCNVEKQTLHDMQTRELIAEIYFKVKESNSFEAFNWFKSKGLRITKCN